MPKLTEESKMERETTIRFDETDFPAVLWTASIAVRNEWMSLGYELKNTGEAGWRTEVPKDRIVFMPLKSYKARGKG